MAWEEISMTLRDLQKTCNIEWDFWGSTEVPPKQSRGYWALPYLTQYSILFKKASPFS